MRKNMATVLWQGSPLSYEQAVEKGCDLAGRLNNKSIDYFACQAREDVALAGSFVRDCCVKWESAVSAVSFFS